MVRRVLVTGGNSGLGFEACKELLKVPDICVVVGSRNLESGRAAVEHLRGADAQNDGRIDLLQIDLLDAASIEAAARAYGEKHGPDSLDCLVNNAGLSSRSPYKDVWQVNMMGTRSVTQAFLPYLTETGRVVHVASISGIMFYPKLSEKWQQKMLHPSPEDFECLDRFVLDQGNDVWGLDSLDSPFDDLEASDPSRPKNDGKPKKTMADIYPYVVVIILLLGVVCVLIGQVLAVNKPDDHGSVIAAGFLDSFLRDKTVSNIEDVIEERQDNFFQKTLDKNTEFFNETLKSSKQYGLVGFLDEMRMGLFLQTLQPGDIVYIQCTFIPGADSWIHDYYANDDLRRVEFRFIQLNPRCTAAELRSNEVPEETKVLYIKDMEGFQATLEHLSANFGNVKAHWHDGPLSFPSYLVIRNGKPFRAITSFYMRAGTVGGMFPHLEWEAVGEDQSQGFIMLLADYLEGKWSELDASPSTVPKDVNIKTQ